MLHCNHNAFHSCNHSITTVPDKIILYKTVGWPRTHPGPMRFCGKNRQFSLIKLKGVTHTVLAGRAKRSMLFGLSNRGLIAGRPSNYICHVQYTIRMRLYARNVNLKCSILFFKFYWVLQDLVTLRLKLNLVSLRSGTNRTIQFSKFFFILTVTYSYF